MFYVNGAPILADELQVKLKYGQNRFIAYGIYFLKLIKNLPRILFAK